MRNGYGTTMTRSSSSTTQHHPQLLTHTSVGEGYDFNRARSSESTENTLTGKIPSATPSLGGCASFCFAPSAEDRGVPLSPKKLPPTPPRDHGSPYRPTEVASNNAAGDQSLPQPPSQPYLFSGAATGIAHPRSFLRPSSWRQKEEDHGSSIFRSSSPLMEGSMKPSRDQDAFYTIQRCLAFDEEDDTDDEGA